MSDDSQDKSQEATPHKLREAKKRGQVAKSTEANYAAVLAALSGICFAAGPGIAQRELAIARRALEQGVHTGWSPDTMTPWLLDLVGAALTALAPLLLAVACAAVAANLAQVGAVFSFEPVTPDFTKLNPANGMQRLFSMRAGYDAARSLLKLAALSAVAWVALRHAAIGLLKLSSVDAHLQAAAVLGEIGPLVFKLALAMLLIALVDVVYSRWDFARKMRMSHRDITDEHKQREGDPRIRSRLRQLRTEMLKQARSARRLPEADVLITNPTHIAIALSYKHGEMPAPKLLAKASGQLAQKMREAARSHGIPVVENRPLARELFKRAGTDEYVPEDLYPRIARILLWVYAMRRQRAGEPA